MFFISIVITILVVFLAALLIYMGKEAFSNRILHHTLSFYEFPKSLNRVTIFFISDIHRRKISDSIISKVTGKADIVVIGGDLTEKGVPFRRVKANILKLTKIAPVYFVWGNNDHEVDIQLLESILLECGVKILANSAYKYESQSGDFFHLLGVDDMAKNRERLDLALDDAQDNGFRLLLSHNPEIIHKIQPEDKIQLVLSGHTHGGQIRVFNYGPYEIGGIKQVGKTILFVSNGYGTTALPLRLGAKSETHLITIKNEDDPRI